MCSAPNTLSRPTPEFLRWAVAQPCALREFDEWQDPEQVERRLRPLRSYSEAVAEGRLFEGICLARETGHDPAQVAQAKGFRAAEVLGAYGGEQFVAGLCGSCPANARRGTEPTPLAGCFGHLEFSGFDDFHQDLESIAGEPGLGMLLAAEFPTTTPRWYGLWMESPPRPARLKLIERLFTGLAGKNAKYRVRLVEFLAAVERCLEHGLELHLTLVPRGEYTATRWTVVSHCERCKAHWPVGSRRCAACGHVGHPAPSRKRHVRGERPYWQLAGFLGPENVEPFVRRYVKANAHRDLA